MKIRIEFNKTEKEAMVNSISLPEVNMSEALEDDRDVKVKGKFGFIDYRKDRYIEINLQEAFFTSYCGLLGKVCGIVYDMAKLYMDFIMDWFDDVEEIEEDRNKEYKNEIEDIKSELSKINVDEEYDYNEVNQKLTDLLYKFKLLPEDIQNENDEIRETIVKYGDKIWQDFLNKED